MASTISRRLVASIPSRAVLPTFRTRPQYQVPSSSVKTYTSTSTRWQESSAEKRAKALNQKSVEDQEDGFNHQIDNAIGEAKELQARTPWHREGSDKPPVKRMRRAGAMTKGWYSIMHNGRKHADLRCLNRKTIDNSISPPKTHPPTHNAR